MVKTWGSVFVRADATNTKALQSMKAHVAEVTTLFRRAQGSTTDDVDTVEDAEVESDAVEVWRCFPPLEKVPHNCGSLEARALLLKQLRSVGVLAWDNQTPTTWEDLEIESMVAVGDMAQHLRVWWFGTDNGADQQGSHTVIKGELAQSPNDLYFRQWCWRHQGHLAVHQQPFQARVRACANARAFTVSHIWS